MSGNVLVTYASKMGATQEIAEAIGTELRARGHTVDVDAADQVRSVEPYDAVVLGSAIYMRRWRPEAVHFLRRNADQLRSRQVWLFHSGPVGPDKDEVQDMPAAVQRLADDIGAAPAVTFAGRLEPETAKGFLARHLATGNLAGDSRDWDQIRSWAAEISAAISPIPDVPGDGYLD
ncbi:flavodoxin domain-containing protein [Kribbella sp. NPDC050470]|uniref:flavodoxin domain-containing protein n=1 Tax=unclassified Kribbella TaxID=2644121 RepID=UPI0037B2C3A7